ncbi:hypothetical protein [Streptomyces viridosporus]|uniref:hypothetical protein n=1 Tax=Streptomyces viridosporus TaxID=67581 RepID=UPI00331E9D59
MSNEQRNQQPQAPAAPRADPRREFTKKGALAVMGGVVSAVARFGTEAVLGALFRDGW